MTSGPQGLTRTNEPWATPFIRTTVELEIRIASREIFPEAEMLPHLICSRPIFIGGANDEADQHGDA